MQYLGHLPQNDPLFGYLREEIFPQLGCRGEAGIRVFKTFGSNDVYIYEDRESDTKVVGKFFYSPLRNNDREHAGRLLEREYRNIKLFRSFLSGTHYAAKALGKNDSLNGLLVVEYCYGEPLDSVITRSIKSHDDGVLFDKLRTLAYFLAAVHNRSARPENVDFQKICDYFKSVVGRLRCWIGSGEEKFLLDLLSQWKILPQMWSDRNVLVHGDATPSNFFFGDGNHVITFDLERVRWSDRVFDVGRLCGELQHFFMRITGNKYLAEPFIGHFLWEYSCHFPDRERTFETLVQRVPFYMGTTLLRIARNGYLDMHYRRQLVQEGAACLRRR